MHLGRWEKHVFRLIWPVERDGCREWNEEVLKRDEWFDNGEPVTQLGPRIILDKFLRANINDTLWAKKREDIPRKMVKPAWMAHK